MKKLALVLALLSTSTPAFACPTYGDITVALQSLDFPVQPIADAAMPALMDGLSKTIGINLGQPTRAFLFNVKGSVRVGLEVKGCMLPAIELLKIAVPQLAGRDHAGHTGA